MKSENRQTDTDREKGRGMRRKGGKRKRGREGDREGEKDLCSSAERDMARG